MRRDTRSGVLTRMSHSLHFSFIHSYYSQTCTCVGLKHFGPQQSKLLMPCWQPANSHQLLLGLLWEFAGRHLQMLYQYRFTSAAEGQTASLVAAWVENALFFLLAKEKEPESKWIAGRQLRSISGVDANSLREGMKLQKLQQLCNFTCNQTAHLQRKLFFPKKALIMLFYPVTPDCSLIIQLRFQALIFLASFSCFSPLSAGICAFFSGQILIINVD